MKIASAVLWADPSSAANRLRSAAEALMDDQGIMRKGLDRKGKTTDLNLHSRIELFQKAKPNLKEVGDLLLAVKFIGNVGSHESILDMHSVLDGVEIFDQALTLLYDNSSRAILDKAAMITARKGKPVDVLTEVPEQWNF
ncbi:DUF4145 domain-containing protein [Streptomyces kaniharaensis]|uniref:DUF4145 domain-containing protein n=1 Tax=Streptomyces kaniharaensis TaxID=212423 RepID=UPI0018A82959|nr:DUF4145 domain-containing protein [Streptomyces kaniharaensis]